MRYDDEERGTDHSTTYVEVVEPGGGSKSCKAADGFEIVRLHGLTSVRPYPGTTECADATAGSDETDSDEGINSVEYPGGGR